MKVFLFIVAAFCILSGGVAYIDAASIMHQLGGLLWFNLAAVLFGSAGIIEAIGKKGSNEQL